MTNAVGLTSRHAGRSAEVRVGQRDPAQVMREPVTNMLHVRAVEHATTPCSSRRNAAVKLVRGDCEVPLKVYTQFRKASLQHVARRIHSLQEVVPLFTVLADEPPE